MRGIDRVIAVILLLGAVGGAAAFARQSGSDLTARAVHLAAPPLQHVGAPGTVLIARVPALTRVKPATVAPAPPQVTLRRPVHAVQPQKPVQPAVVKPAPAPIETPPPPIQTPPPPVQAPPAPIPTPEPPRALAVVQPVVVQPDPVRGKGSGHGHNGGHSKQDEQAQASGAPVPTPADIPVAQPLTADSSGDQHGNGNDGHGNDNGNSRAYGSGHDQGGGSKQSGD